MRLLAMGSPLLFLLLAGCGQASSPCDQVAQQKKDVLDDWCAGKDATCWYCKCRNRDEQVKATPEGDTIVFSCVPAPDKPAVACEGTALEQAQDCLSKEQSCVVDASTLEATSKCGATKG